MYIFFILTHFIRRRGECCLLQKSCAENVIILFTLLKFSMSEKLTVMVNGLPGSMGLEVAAACLRRGYNVASVALTGKTKGTCEISAETTEDNKQTVQLIPSNTETTESELRTYIESIRGPLIVVDYTHPSAVNANGELYAKLKIPFVMGTTGGDRTKLYSDTEQAGTYAVIAANMCKQIVALQTVLENMSVQFPGAFEGYKLNVTESHQSHKADTSGTAKEMVKYFNGLTSSSYQISDIVKHRDTISQKGKCMKVESINN